jgi:hypothetical protein
MITFIVSQQEEIRARELFEALKKTRQEYLIERMKKIVHSASYQFDDDSFFHEKTVTFTSINSQIQDQYLTSITRAFTIKRIDIQESYVDQISHSFAIIENQNNQEFSFILAHIIFDLKDFLSSLKTIIFDKDEIEKDVLIDQVQADFISKRIVLKSFNESEAIMRRIVDFDNQENKISTKSVEYKIYKDASLKIRNIIYRKK